MFQRWTNDVWVSTKHRVVVPKDVHSRGERISFAYFILLSPDVMVSCLHLQHARCVGGGGGGCTTADEEAAPWVAHATPCRRPS